MTDLLAEILAGSYQHPQDDRLLSVPTRSVVIADSLAGREAELVGALSMGRNLAVVSDGETHRVLGARVERALESIARVTGIVLPGRPHADEETAEALQRVTQSADALIAVGSGTLNDLCKMAAAKQGKPCAVFGTAPSMNGYTSVNASIAVQGMKKTLPATAPLGVFLDLKVLADAPQRMIRSGLGDSLCRPTAQADWLLAHLLLGRPYREAPFTLLSEDESALFAEPEALLAGDLRAMERLARTLVLSGFGMTIYGGSEPASQGEHLISHYLEMMGPQGCPASFHGEQIGVATLTMARLQDQMLAGGPPRMVPSPVTQAQVLAHFGERIGPACWDAFSHKHLDAEKAGKLNETLEARWDEIRERLHSITLPVAFLQDVLKRAGAPIRAAQLEWPTGFDSKSLYNNAVRHAREIRNRYTFLDLAGDAGILNGMDFS